MSKVWNDKEIKGGIDIVKACKTSSEASSKLIKKINRTWSALEAAIKRRGHGSIGSYLKKGILQQIEVKQLEPKEVIEKQSREKKLLDELNQYKTLYNEAVKTNMRSETVSGILSEISGVTPDPRPTWCVKDRDFAHHGTPILNLSDLHWDETVIKEQVNGMNEYNPVIQERRLDWTFYKTTDILLNRFAKPSYDGLKLLCNGDLVTGIIHEEARETNARPIFKTVVDLADKIIANVEQFQSDTGLPVDIEFQVGNHGRLDKKPRFKNGVIDNYEWMLATYVSKHFKDNDLITVHVPESYDSFFEIYKLRFYMSHGDAYTGGNGIGGILVPIMRGLHKKKVSFSAQGRDFDIHIIGHFHQEHSLSNLFINGSLKGCDEWTLKKGFSAEDPQQQLIFVSPTEGIEMTIPIKSNGYLNEG